MSMKALFVTAAGVLAVSPAFAMSNSQIVHHTSGPIPYSQLSSMDKSGYNARSHHKGKAAAVSDTTVASNASPDATAPATTPTAAPAPEAAPSGAVNPPAPAAPDPGSPAAAQLPPATVAPTTPAPTPGAVTPPSSQQQ